MSWRSAIPFLNSKLLISLWVSGVAVGFALLTSHQAEPSASAREPVQVMRGNAGLLDAERPTLLVFAHPHCPCTRATLDELDRIAARCVGRLKIVVLFSSDPKLGETWTHTDLWDRARSIPGVDVRSDTFGRTAHELGVETSGQALLYSADGRLAFQGGLTSARGHSGDNDGEDAVVDFANGRIPTCASTPVYGCRLVSAGDEFSTGDTP